jgi:hypothetical protein
MGKEKRHTFRLWKNKIHEVTGAAILLVLLSSSMTAHPLEGCNIHTQDRVCYRFHFLQVFKQSSVIILNL